MSRIRKTDTKPEMAVRTLAHEMGFRFRLHRRDLPGTPDVVFPRLRKIIFVHGCFWHQHDCRLGAKQPRSNQHYWLPKLARTVERDEMAREQLERDGWQVMVVWECQTKTPADLKQLVASFLAGAASTPK